jgi:NADPH-dependent ferric siderophore reductase
MNIIKQKALSLIENAIGKTGTVLAVRAWEPATFFEVDVHFPDMDMSSWKRVQHIKIKVATGIYRDYTPAGWDEDVRTCTLYINAEQNGPGSNWIKSLKEGDSITYVGVGATFHKPAETGEMVVFGDMSSIGHYLALQQLAGGKAISGAITISRESHQEEFLEYFNWKIQPILQTDMGGLDSILKWAKNRPLTDSNIYISGHIPTCVQLRKELKKRKDSPRGILVQGFWT